MPGLKPGTVGRRLPARIYHAAWIEPLNLLSMKSFTGCER